MTLNPEGTGFGAFDSDNPEIPVEYPEILRRDSPTISYAITRNYPGYGDDDGDYQLNAVDPSGGQTDAATPGPVTNTITYGSRPNLFTRITVNKAKITGWVYDHATVDGDRVAVYWKGKLIPGLENVSLTKNGTKFRVDIKPGVNTLSFKILSIGQLTNDGNARPPCTIGVKLDKTNMSAGDEVQTAGAFYGDTPSISFGFSYITIPSWRAPESAAHLQEAQAVGYAKLVTIEKNEDAANDRRYRTRVNYLSNPVRGLTAEDGSQEYDEYPPAAFPENAGRGHVRPINKPDNQRAGGKIGSQSRLYYNVGEVVELAVSWL